VKSRKSATRLRSASYLFVNVISPRSGMARHLGSFATNSRSLRLWDPMPGSSGLMAGLPSAHFVKSDSAAISFFLRVLNSIDLYIWPTRSMQCMFSCWMVCGMEMKALLFYRPLPSCSENSRQTWRLSLTSAASRGHSLIFTGIISIVYHICSDSPTRRWAHDDIELKLPCNGEES